MLLTVKQLAERLNVGQSTIYELIRSGRLAVYRVGLKRGVIRVSEEALEAYLKSRLQAEHGAEPEPQPVGTRHTLRHLKL